MTGGIVAGFVTGFATAAAELSATMMLVQSTANAPLSYGLYVFMQSPAGRRPGAALGIARARRRPLDVQSLQKSLRRL
jgi:iron(III) transport system permease protein